MTSTPINYFKKIIQPVLILFLATSFSPSDAKTPPKYQQTCGVCHESGNLNAPKTGDKPAWEKLKAKKGMDGLIKSTKDGMPQMPAKGLCNTCSDEELRELIIYMSK